MAKKEQKRAPVQTRRRGDALVQGIHAAALAELVAVGLGRLTMEGIAKRAGTAKTSLYRRWSSPHEVLLDAIDSEHPQEVPSPAADDLRGDLLRALQQLVAWLSTPTAAAVAAIMAERRHYPDLARALYERVFDARGGRFTLTVLRFYAAAARSTPHGSRRWWPTSARRWCSSWRSTPTRPPATRNSSQSWIRRFSRRSASARARGPPNPDRTSRAYVRASPSISWSSHSGGRESTNHASASARPQRGGAGPESPRSRLFALDCM